MAEQSGEGTERGGDRRRNDRRRTDRRTPAPVWRRPWAYVAYGVLGALLLVLIFGGDDEPASDADTGEVVTAPARPGVVATPQRAAAAPVRDAFGAAGFARLVSEGQAAVGQRVRTELFCGPIDPLSLQDIDRVNSSIAAVTDAEGRVPATECEWGGAGQAARENFWLIVPPAVAEAFAGAPVVTRNFVQRRRLVAEVEWIGRSEALALRMTGVLRRVD